MKRTLIILALAISFTFIISYSYSQYRGKSGDTAKKRCVTECKQTYYGCIEQHKYDTAGKSICLGRYKECAKMCKRK
jgi:hypothetical protein